MKPAELENLLNAQPFESVRVYMDDGRTFEISRKEGVLFTRTMLGIGRNPSKRGIFRGADFYPVDHIVRVEKASAARKGVRRAS